MSKVYAHNQFSLCLPVAQCSPADSLTYYFWPNVGAIAPTFGFPNTNWSPEREIIITDFGINFLINGTNGSSEFNNFYLTELAPVSGQNWYAGIVDRGPAWKMDHPLLKNVPFNMTLGYHYYNTDLRIHIKPTRLYVIRWDTPNYGTNPTALNMNIHFAGYYLDLNPS